MSNKAHNIFGGPFDNLTSTTMYFPDYFDSLNSNSNSNNSNQSAAVPTMPDMTLLRSQETVATLGSMNTEFVDLMKSGINDDMNDDMMMNTVSVEDDDDDDDTEKQSLPPLEMLPLEHSASFTRAVASLEMEYLSDDSSVFQQPQPHPHQDVVDDTPSTADRASPKQTQEADVVHNKARGSPIVKRQKHRRIRKSFDIAPTQRRYVRYTDADVLCQRGGLANKHVGNHRYLAAKETLQDVYRATPKAGRTAVAQRLVDLVHGWGGRFLRYDGKKGGWYEIHNHTARTKAGQALRESYTPEDRKEKRDRYRQQQQQQQQQLDGSWVEAV